MDPSIRDRRLLVLCTATGYQTRAFVEAAKKIGLSVVFGTDRCRVLEDPWRDGALPLRFENPEESARRIVDYARSSPVDAIVALGDRPDRKSTRLNSSHGYISYAVFCLKKKILDDKLAGFLDDHREYT